MHLSSSKNPDIVGEELLYSRFNHIEFSAKALSAIEEIFSSEASLVYNSEEKTLEIIADNCYDSFSIWIVNTGGAIVANLKTLPGYKVYLPSLPVGLYVAVAYNNDIQLKTKIIIQ